MEAADSYSKSPGRKIKSGQNHSKVKWLLFVTICLRQCQQVNSTAILNFLFTCLPLLQRLKKAKYLLSQPPQNIASDRFKRMRHRCKTTGKILPASCSLLPALRNMMPKASCNYKVTNYEDKKKVNFNPAYPSPSINNCQNMNNCFIYTYPLLYYHLRR